jgi:hypothetical protein
VQRNQAVAISCTAAHKHECGLSHYVHTVLSFLLLPLVVASGCSSKDSISMHVTALRASVVVVVAVFASNMHSTCTPTAMLACTLSIATLVMQYAILCMDTRDARTHLLP